MALYARLLGLEFPKIPVHGFMSLIGEVRRGKLTALQAANLINLSAAERTEATTLLATGVTAVELHEVLLLGEMRLAGYDTEANIKARLGV